MAKSARLTPANFEQIIPVLHAGGVEFIVIGGGAALAHGLARMTFDVDVVYSRDAANVRRLVDVLQPYQPYPRDAPPGLPFRFDEGTLRLGMNFTLSTTLGYLDLLGEVTGGGAYADLLPHTEILDSYGLPIRYVTQDFEVLAELEVLREERQK